MVPSDDDAGSSTASDGGTDGEREADERGSDDRKPDDRKADDRDPEGYTPDDATENGRSTKGGSPTDDSAADPSSADPSAADSSTGGRTTDTPRDDAPASATAREGVEPSGDAAYTPFVAGAVGGLVGAAAFGALMWLVNPAFLRSSIPAFYGLEPRGVFGWSVHLLHGLVLGVGFGAIVSREAAREALVPTDPDQLGPAGVRIRLVGAGVAFGIAVWALIPVVVLPAVSWGGGADQWGVLSISGAESLAGHVVFGLLLGVVYAVLVARD